MIGAVDSNEFERGFATLDGNWVVMNVPLNSMTVVDSNRTATVLQDLNNIDILIDWGYTYVQMLLSSGTIATSS